METKEYLVPEYFDSFQCKCGDCRTCCCTGWGISVSLAEYHRLLGMECADELRRKLDCALHPASSPTPERYAMLGPGWDMRCPLQAENGLCNLQTEKGAEALPAVCRLYPRAFRNAYTPEGGMSGSCERVIELLFSIKTPLRFVTRTLSPEFVPSPPAKNGISAELYRFIRLFSIQTIQDRALALNARVNHLCRSLIEMDSNKSSNLSVYRGAWDDAPPADDFSAFLFALGVTGILGDSSESLSGYFAETLANLMLPPPGDCPNVVSLLNGHRLFREASAEFMKKYPDESVYFEHALVNHIFFTEFPFSDLRDNFADESAALAATYLVLRFMCIAYTFHKEGTEPLVDVMAACFRVMEHSAFDYNACRAVIRLENKHGIRLPEAIERI